MLLWILNLGCAGGGGIVPPPPPPPPPIEIQTGGQFVGYTQNQARYQDYIISESDRKTQIAKDDEEILLFIKMFTEWL
jgi:hypothetical protein